MTLLEIVEASPPGTMYTREGLLSLLRKQEREAEQRRQMVGTTTALQLLGWPEADARKLRRAAARWELSQARGQRPPIRVSRKGEADASDWLYDREDCLSYRKKGDPAIRVLRPAGGPRPAPEEADDIAERFLKRHHGR